MNNLRKDLELVEVVYDNDNKKAILRFLDIENGELLEVNFNKQVYENGKYIDDKEKAQKVDEWCERYFGTTFDDLCSKVGEKFDVYRYERFNSMWESEVIEKFNIEDKGKIYNTNIKSIEDNGQKISIKYEIDGKLYETKMQYSDYMEDFNAWFKNPQKELKQKEKFKEKFGVDVENADELVGKPIMVEVKVAFNKYAYGDIKKPSWR